MVKRNPNLAKLNAGYLFPEINKRKKAILEKHPEARLISLGVGDTTEPLPAHIANALKRYSEGLGTLEGYSGYGTEQGNTLLRNRIADKLYGNLVTEDEVFISDGTKCDIGRLQLLFGSDVTIAVQDPSYPAYVDSAVILGQTGSFEKKSSQYEGIVYLLCKPENDFFPDLAATPRTDLIYFCSPNNPTGAVATKEQLTALVAFAKERGSIIIFDAAYAAYIRNPALPKSIYEIEGAKEVAIELGSFSKMIGFTGVRLGWSIVPNALCFEDGTPVRKDWHRIVSTLFNGASSIAQQGGIAALDEQGMKDMDAMVSFYLENAHILKETMQSLGLQTFGGSDTPYIWTRFPKNSSWEAFEYILEKTGIVTTPGSGFGPAGEGFIRFSSYGHRETILEACERLKRQLF